MQKRKYIISFLLFAYLIVLGHAIVPHGHFDDLFSSEHHKTTHNNSDHDHDFPISHSVTLHVALEKQLVVTSHFIKNITKKAPSNNLYCIPGIFQPLFITSFSSIQYKRYSASPAQVGIASFSNRGPPVDVV